MLDDMEVIIVISDAIGRAVPINYLTGGVHEVGESSRCVDDDA